MVIEGQNMLIWKENIKCEAPWEKGPDVAQTRSEIFDFIEKYRIF